MLASVCGAYALFCAPAGARAAPFTVSLGYEASAGCPDANEFQELVQARLGYDPFTEQSSNHAFVKVVHHGDSLAGTIEWRDANGRWLGDQVVPSARTDCRRLARTVALALTVQIRLLASAAGPAPETTLPPDPGPPAEAPPAKPVVPPALPAPVPAPVVTAPATEARPAARAAGPLLDVGAGSSVGFGMSADPVFLGRVVGSLSWPGVSLELAVEGSLPTTTRRADGAGFSQQHFLASPAVCVLRGRFRACAVVKVGEARMAGNEIDRPTTATVPMFEGGARLGFVQGLGRHFFLASHADGLVNVVRWTGALDEVPVWTAPRFAAVVGIDVGVALPWSGGATSR